MKYLKTYEKIKKAPEKSIPDVNISVDVLKRYANAKKLIEKFKKDYKEELEFYANKYINYYEERLGDFDFDEDDDEFYAEDITIMDEYIKIRVEYDDEWVDDMKVPFDEFVDFCNNYETYINAKKYNI